MESDGEDEEDEESDDGIGGDTLTFLIGQDQEQFRIPVARALRNSYILEDTVQDNNLGAIVTGSRWVPLKTEAFCPIYEYFKYGDYRPRYEDGHLTGLRNTFQDHGREVVRCGQVFSLARELQIDALMGLVCLKFGLLNKQPLPVMFAVRSVYKRESDGTKNDAMMRKLLTDEVANNYQAYMIEQARDLFAQQAKTPEFGLEVSKKYVAMLEKKGGWA